MQIDETKLVEKIIKMSPNAKEKNLTKIMTEVDSLINNEHNLWQVCNGHDFMKVLALYIGAKNKKGIDNKELAQRFRLAYHITDFKITALYRASNAWANSKNIILYR